MADDVTLVSPQGEATTVPAAQAEAYRARGFKDESDEGAIARTAKRVNEDQTSTGEALVQGVARGATFGLSDALQRAVGGEDARLHLEHTKEAHGGASLVGELGGGLLAGGVAGKLGTAVESGLGGGAIGGFAGAAAEGAAYGAGQGVSELALSDEPITAERAVSVLSSNALLGGALAGGLHGAGALVAKGLDKASAAVNEAAAARSALEGISPELQGLDDAGLKAARVTAEAEHTADIAAERKSIEELRVNQRAELANQIRDLHTDLATERPIFKAITEADGSTLNPALKGIDGVQDAQVQLAKSFKSMRAGLDSEISVARDPSSMIRPLEMRQAALEKLQAAESEIRAALAGDARAAVLDHVDTALEQTKQQIQAVQALKAPAQPTGRLAMLTSGPSAKMQAIDAARTALKNGPELGLVGKAATTAAFAGGTAIAHAIPGVGIAAPFIGKAASDAVGTLFKRLGGAVDASAAKSAEAAKAFLSTGQKLTPIIPSTATKVLSAVKFGQGPEPKSAELVDLFKARSAELKQQTQYAPDGSVQMRPEARMALAAKFDAVRHVSPTLADKMESVAARKVAFMSSKIPRRPDVDGLQIGPDTWRPTDLAIRSWARTVRACEDPDGVEQRLAEGTLTPEDAEAYRTVYPERYAAMQQTIFQQAPLLAKTLPMKKKMALSIFTGVPLIPALSPRIMAVTQAVYAVEPGSGGGAQAPSAQPNFGAMGSLKDMDKPTKSQARSEV